MVFDLLGIRFLKQRTPKLVWVFGLQEEEWVNKFRYAGQSVVHNNVYPLAKVPEAKAKYTAVTVVETLVWRDHLGGSDSHINDAYGRLL